MENDKVRRFLRHSADMHG